MADVAKVLVGIARGDFDANLGDIGDALSLRQADLVDHQIAAVALAAYMKQTGISLEDIVAQVVKE